jgi:hypothetical protein
MQLIKLEERPTAVTLSYTKALRSMVSSTIRSGRTVNYGPKKYASVKGLENNIC